MNNRYLYSIVYEESAFSALTQHPAHFRTLESAIKFAHEQVNTSNPIIVRVPIVTTLLS